MLPHGEVGVCGASIPSPECWGKYCTGFGVDDKPQRRLRQIPALAWGEIHRPASTAEELDALSPALSGVNDVADPKLNARGDREVSARAGRVHLWSSVQRGRSGSAVKSQAAVPSLTNITCPSSDSILDRRPHRYRWTPGETKGKKHRFFTVTAVVVAKRFVGIAVRDHDPVDRLPRAVGHSHQHLDPFGHHCLHHTFGVGVFAPGKRVSHRLFW